MNNDELILRQQRLLMRSSELRIKLTDQVQVFKKPLALVDQARAGLQWLYRNPQWPLGVLLAIVVLRPRRAIIWSSRLWWAWNSVKRVKRFIAKLPIQRPKP